MSKYSAQGSITIRRLRNGDSFFITLELNGKPLYQGVVEGTGAVAPDWSVADNQPVITPNVTSARGNSVSLSNHQWEYNGVALNFSGAESDGWTLDSTGKFKINATTGALRIVANLASETNCANDTLTYSCVATVGGVEYNISKSIDVQIQTVGASSYTGFITATTEQLTAGVSDSILSTSLTLGVTSVTAYYVKWYKDDTLWSEKNGSKTITVGRDDVDGTQLFIAEFYKDSSASEPLYRAGIRILDTLDDYQVQWETTSANVEVSQGKDVTVEASVVNMRTHNKESLSNPSWVLSVMKKDGWKLIRSVNTNTVTITTADTDDASSGEINDVEIVAEVTFD